MTIEIHNADIESTTAPTSLRELHELLVDGSVWDGAPIKHGEIDLTSLPTFGGDEPADTSEVWSWDETSELVGSCIGDMKILPRNWRE
jgi:hypothetical protein